MLALEISNLKKVYGNGFEALKGINFSVKQGDFFALLGPNGAGKSTTIGIITSLVNKTSGQVKVFGKDIDEQLEAAKRHIGLVPQEFNFNVFETVLQIVLNQAGYYGIPRSAARDRAEQILKKLGLWEKRNQAGRMLSGGMKRRLMIARALVHQPQLLILDEPTAGVDIELRRSMWHFLQEINQQGVTIILTTHYLEEAESLCRQIGIINHGELIELTDMQSLLQKLNVETFVLYLSWPADEAVMAQVTDALSFPVVFNDPLTIEVEISEGQVLNDVFRVLDQHNVQVKSMRNKVNRLEELFLRLTTA